MLKPLSVKMDDDVLAQADRFSQQKKISRNAYINQAVRLFNRLQGRRSLRETLRHESFLVRDSSLQALTDFDSLIDEGL